MNQKLQVKTGDLITHKDKDIWHIVKILAVDQWPDGTSSAHCLTYNPTLSKPSLDSLKQASVRIWHAPINSSSFEEEWELIGNQPPSKDELIGFVEYLKRTDFPRYVKFTDQDSQAIIHRANEHYKRANLFADQGKRAEAISEYTKAMDLFPLFYEAIDNRGLTYMELGNFREAIRDFELSLDVNPNGMTAFFSRGECLMKLGDLAAAEAIFREGINLFPEQREIFEKFLNYVSTLKK